MQTGADQTDANSMSGGEYDGCLSGKNACPTLTDQTRLFDARDRVKGPPDQNKGGLHIFGAHVGWDSASIQPVARGVVTGLHPNFAGIIASGNDDAPMGAFDLRVTSEVIYQNGGKVEIALAFDAWQEAQALPDSEKKGIILGNLMAQVKRYDEATGDPEYRHSRELLRRVMTELGDDLWKESPSPTRYWLAKTLYDGHIPGMRALYQNMLNNGDSREIDVALNSINLFELNHDVPANTTPREVAQGYQQTLFQLTVDKTNPHLDMPFKDDNGETVNLRDKAADALLKLDGMLN